MNQIVSSKSLTHLDRRGRAHMVNVGGKPITRRRAVAVGFLEAGPAFLGALAEGSLPKGDAFAAARIAGIMAAKKTSDLIPLCHPLVLESITVDFERLPQKIKITATVTLEGKTGAEMEALAAVSVAALTLYDMGKAVDKAMTIGPIYLMEKSGGMSGDFRRGGP